MYTRKEDVVKISSPNFWVYAVSTLFIFIGIYFYVEYGDLKAVIFFFAGFLGFFSNSSTTLYVDLENKDLKFHKRGIFTSKTFRYHLDNISEVVLYNKKEPNEKGDGYTVLYSVFLITKEKEQISTDGFSDPTVVQINSWSSFYKKNRKIAERISLATKVSWVEKEKSGMI